MIAADTSEPGEQSLKTQIAFQEFLDSLVNAAKEEKWELVSEVKEEIKQFIINYKDDLDKDEDVANIIALSLYSGTHPNEYRESFSYDQYKDIDRFRELFCYALNKPDFQKNENGQILNNQHNEKLYLEMGQRDLEWKNFYNLRTGPLFNIFQAIETIEKQLRSLPYFVNKKIEDYTGSRLLLAGGTYYSGNTETDNEYRKKAANDWYSVDVDPLCLPDVVADLKNFEIYNYLNKKKFDVIMLEYCYFPTTTIAKFYELLTEGGVYYTPLYNDHIFQLLTEYAPDLAVDPAYLYSSYLESNEENKKRFRNAVELSFKKKFGFSKVIVDHTPKKSKYFRSGKDIHWIKEQLLTPQELQHIVEDDQEKEENITSSYRGRIAIFCVK